MTVQTGMLGQDYEDQLNMRGFIGGHYPQSIRCSTVGGWIAPRGVGTFSSKYGKIEDIVQSLEIVLADGSVARTKNYPACFLRAGHGPAVHRFRGHAGHHHRGHAAHLAHAGQADVDRLRDADVRGGCSCLP